jgi:hypothetical protein
MNGRCKRRTSRHALRAIAAQIESTSPSGSRCGFGSELPSMTGRDLKFDQRHSLQHRWISLAFLGGAKDGLSYGLHMCGTDRVGQRRNRRVQGIFHDAYGLRWKRRVRKVFHLKSISVEFLKATSPPSTPSNRSVRLTRYGGNLLGFLLRAARSLSPISVQIAPLSTLSI